MCDAWMSLAVTRFAESFARAWLRTCRWETSISEMDRLAHHRCTSSKSTGFLGGPFATSRSRLNECDTFRSAIGPGQRPSAVDGRGRTAQVALLRLLMLPVSVPEWPVPVPFPPLAAAQLPTCCTVLQSAVRRVDELSRKGGDEDEPAVRLTVLCSRSFERTAMILPRCPMTTSLPELSHSCRLGGQCSTGTGR